MTFRYWFFNQLPLYFKQNDTYKDNTGHGLLERYLQIFGLELDNNVIPLIDNYLNNIDPYTVDPKFLTTLGYSLGSPPQLTGNTADYAKLLAYIIAVYKIKGTAKAYELLFALLGYSIGVIELPPKDYAFLDKSEDLDTDPYIFDSGCPTCSDYEIVVYTVLEDCYGEVVITFHGPDPTTGTPDADITITLPDGALAPVSWIGPGQDRPLQNVVDEINTHANGYSATSHGKILIIRTPIAQVGSSVSIVNATVLVNNGTVTQSFTIEDVCTIPSCSVPANNTIDNTILSTFEAIIRFNEPINANLIGLIDGAKVCESIEYCVGNLVSWSVLAISAFDDGILLDSLAIMDDATLVDSGSLFVDCSRNSDGSFNPDFDDSFDIGG